MVGSPHFNNSEAFHLFLVEKLGLGFSGNTEKISCLPVEYKAAYTPRKLHRVQEPICEHDVRVISSRVILQKVQFLSNQYIFCI